MIEPPPTDTMHNIYMFTLQGTVIEHSLESVTLKCLILYLTRRRIQGGYKSCNTEAIKGLGSKIISSVWETEMLPIHRCPTLSCKFRPRKKGWG